MPSNRRRQSPLVWVMPIGTLLQFVLPRWLTVQAAALAGLIAWRFNLRKRRMVCENLRHILGSEVDTATLNRMCRRVFQNLATNYSDLLRTPVLRRRLRQLVEADTTHLDRAMARGRGAILVTAHVGNWDLAGAYLGARGYPTSAVVEPVPRGWAKTFNRYRSATRLETIPLTDRRGIASAIRRHRLLALVSDRDLTGRGLTCPSFDAARSFPRGPAAYALRYRVPVLLGYIVLRDAPGRRPYLGVVEPPLAFSPTGNQSTDIDAFTRLIASRLNEIISRHPDQWLVFTAGWQPLS